VCLYSVLGIVTTNGHCKMFECHSGCGPNCMLSYDKFPFSALVHRGKGATFCQRILNDNVCFCNPGYTGYGCNESKYSFSCFLCILLRFLTLHRPSFYNDCCGVIDSSWEHTHPLSLLMPTCHLFDGQRKKLCL
jgi:hypothetical protein